MKDSEVRGRVLRFLYENRREAFIAFGPIQRGCEIPSDIELKDWLRACQQLADYNLITWHPLEDHTGMGLLGGVAAINGFGTDVIEGEVAAPIPIQVVDQRQQITVSDSHGVQIAGANSSQQQSVTEALDAVISAIDKAAVSEPEKEKTRSLLLKVLDSKAAAAVLGAGANYLAAKLQKS
jgi:hypothetical protein